MKVVRGIPCHCMKVVWGVPFALHDEGRVGHHPALALRI